MAIILSCVILVLCLFSVNSAIPQQNVADSTGYEHSSLIMKPPYCGTIEESTSRVVGGENVAINEFPWMVFVLPVVCGGSLITNRFVLTAGHCYLPNVFYKVHLGTLQADGEGPNAKTIPVERFIRHELYSNKEVVLNDIALIKMRYSVDFTASIKPICLPYKTASPFDFVHNDAITAGWGKLADGSYSKVLQKATVSVWDFDKCKALKSSLKAENHICAVGSEGKGSCGGDSGGPLFMQLSKTDKSVSYWIQFGIVSFGVKTSECGLQENPTVYENVTTHIEWIEKKMRENQ